MQEIMYIIIEGIDNIGKTTFCRKLCKILNHYKRTYYTHQFDTDLGREAKKKLLSDDRMSIQQKLDLIRSAREKWFKEKMSDKDPTKCHVIIDRFYLSMIAYQSEEYLIPISHEIFEPEKNLAKDMEFSSLLIYINAIFPQEMNKNPTDYIERRPSSWHRDVQEKYKILMSSYYVRGASLILNVTPEYNYDISIEEVVKVILAKEYQILNNCDAIKLKRKLLIHHKYACMRKAKRQRKLPF